jgi:YidC/Oxa1 family membrane protein insertase
MSFLATLLTPALAIVALTVVVRLVLHPFTRAAVRGEKARARLAPQVAKLRDKHKDDPAVFATKLTELHREAGISPFAGMLPMLVQIPFFIWLYQQVIGDSLGGGELWGVPLEAHLPSGGWVFAALLAAVAVVAALTAVRQARLTDPALTGWMAKLPKVLPFLTVVSAAVLPLAVGVYLLTTTAWSLGENALLKRGVPVT